MTAVCLVEKTSAEAVPLRPVCARAQLLSQVSSDVSPDGMVEELEADVTRTAGGEKGQDRAVGS